MNPIVDRLHIRQPQVSKHLRVLHEAGVVEYNTEANSSHLQATIGAFQRIKFLDGTIS
ncbi:ArsR family transcriptional regulator [Paenibacillus kribbensis]|uniref:ArsR family transcriptional regulator n=1 Tax=Paenibacillus kribbensis TaxID=172713 RepID=UPI002118FFCE|nr:ArsR family transcriptional regulator [Paenibacillus kribbensis]